MFNWLLNTSLIVAKEKEQINSYKTKTPRAKTLAENITSTFPN